MQWDESENAGVTTGTPWFAVNPNYKTINAAAQVEDPDSIYNYYRKLIELRKEEEVIVYGTFDGLEDADENLYIYTRSSENKKILVILFLRFLQYFFYPTPLCLRWLFYYHYFQ